MASDNLKARIKSPEDAQPELKAHDNVGVSAAYSTDSELAGRERARFHDEPTFEMTEDAQFYKPIDTYEGIHRWDPDFEWSPEEEKKIVRKVRLTPVNLRSVRKGLSNLNL